MESGDNSSTVPADAEATPAEIADLRAIVEGTATTTGEAFFESLVRNLAAILKVRYVFVAEFDGGTTARTLAFWSGDRLAPNIEFDLRGTPCEEVIAGQLCHHPRGVAQSFPEDKALVELGAESYLGVPLRDRDGKTLGHLAILDDRPMPPEPRRLFVFHIFASRAAAELDRADIDRRLRESAERHRDLYEEAPIAYVMEDLESRFISANRAAMRILGITPEQVAGTVGMSFIPDTPEAQRRVKEAFESIGRGTDTAGVILELRRKDNGKPIWIQWWSRPDPSGRFTRTMFIDITDRVLMEREKARLEQQNLYLQEEIKSDHNFEEIIGRSKPLVAVLDGVAQVSATDATVLILGETGTGKELIARAIHSNSRRRDRPLIKINCAALPTGLVESELFGHERGAFSGALNRRIGRFELANGGTIFLDEIGEVPLEVQAKLLRVLQEREFERVGGSNTISVDVRVIAATNRDLRKAIAEGTFREDLFYRLNVFPIQLPPLRERDNDIPLLVSFLVNKFANRIGKQITGVDGESMQRLLSYPWPGNVRELENVVERAVILSPGPMVVIEAAALPMSAAAAATASAAPSPTTNLESVGRNHILQVLRQSKWVIEGPNGAAQALGLHPNTLRSRLKKLGIARPTHESS